MATEGDDTIFGTSAGESLGGGGGNDTIFARGGNDYLDGGSGNDVLFGEGGDDTFDPGLGNDQIFGGLGTDTVSYSPQSGAVTVDLSRGVATKSYDGGTDQLFSIENIQGSHYADILIGDGHDNTINGGFGADTITLGGGRDTYYLSDHSEIADTITDFVSGEDILQFHTNEVFRDGDHRPPKGVLGEEYFVEGSSAQTATQYLIYNSADHTIYYDPDANGTTYQPHALIHLSEGATVAASDFLMV
jgi:Hemolysin-type calcium-binding repeat (2 copies).